jgi:hypothetical protein
LTSVLLRRHWPDRGSALSGDPIVFQPGHRPAVALEPQTWSPS